MSVPCEFISVIVRCDVLADRYPGGVAGYRRDCPNRSFRTDGELTRVGFMGGLDAQAWIDRLVSVAGLTPSADGRFRDLAVVDELGGPTLPCDWLETGPGTDVMRVAWLVTPPPYADPT